MTIHRLTEELASLKEELSTLAGENAAAAWSASREKMEDAGKLLEGVMADIEQFVAREEETVENFVAARPLVSVAAAFLAGLAVGVILRRR